ncbi:MAG: DUF4445 domain-containing protein, partial [Deltaproteobacteria bacterium]|nr:DUF4445 domain-containing protein [Deltaproteobacteria bacterium]
ARLIALSNHLRVEVSSVVSKVTNFELSENPAYMDYYIASLFLPHTDRRFFPGIYRKMAI